MVKTTSEEVGRIIFLSSSICIQSRWVGEGILREGLKDGEYVLVVLTKLEGTKGLYCTRSIM